MTIEVKNPFQFFTDRNGLPLESGFIYIGEFGQNPQAAPSDVYWDEDQTIAAAQPIRTISGYPVRNGSVARIYAPSSYSILVTDRNGALVWSSLNSGTAEQGISFYPATGSFVSDGLTSTFDIPGAFDSTALIKLEIGGAEQASDRYTADVSIDLSKTTVTWLGHSGFAATPFPKSAAVVWTAFAQPLNADMSAIAASGFGSRVDLVLWWSAFKDSVADGTVVSDGSVSYFKQSAATDISDLHGAIPAGQIEAAHWGPDITGATDVTAKVQEFLDYCEGRSGYWTPGIYRIDGALTLPSNAVITGIIGDDAATYGTRLRQYGSKLFVGENITHLTLSGFMARLYKSSPNGWDCLFSLGAHANCNIEKFRAIAYNSSTIIERMPTAAATMNTVDNLYSDWSINGATAIDVAIGLEAYYYRHQGDGATTIIPTGVVWPEQNTGSVMVLKESSTRVATELLHGTDYTVSYDGSNRLTVTLTVAATALERIHIWPAAPRTDGSRRPISNNDWRYIRCSYLYSRGFSSFRWVDAETHHFGRLLAAADGTKLYVTNPYATRNGQGGDYITLRDSIFGYQESLITDVATLKAMDFGPGTNAVQGHGIRMDQNWLVGTTNHALTYRSGLRVELTGTFSGTSGTNVLTGTGTNCLLELSRIGYVVDQIEVDGKYYAIASIDSATQVTTVAALTTSPAGATAYRISVNSETSAEMTFASMGDGVTQKKAGSVGRITFNSRTRQGGNVVIPNGASSVTVSHRLRRTPLVHEITLTSGSNLNGRGLSLSSIGLNDFIINLSSAAAADYTIGWKAELKELN